LGISRSSIYYGPVPVSAFELDLLHRIDTIHTDFPYYGTRKIAAELTRQTKYAIGRKYTRTLMKTAGIEALYPKPRLSIGDKNHKIYPYLLKGVSINQPNHVWSADITYIRMKKSFLYLVAFIDWYSRYILSWELSDTLRSGFCIVAAKQSIQHQTSPKIVNFDQGTQFTDKKMINLWEENNVKISMDHRGRCFDNIFIERFWRTLKYEEVYLREYTTIREVRESLSAYIDKYNTRRLHQSLGYKPPAKIYFAN
jgi:putative transposase